MSYKEEVIDQVYYILIKALIGKQDTIFNNVDTQRVALGRLVYLYVSLFGNYSTDENFLVSFIRVIREVFQSIDVDSKEVYKTVVQFKMALDDLGSECGGNKVGPSEVDDEKAGYIYVLINPSMSGLVKIGHTKRNPKFRVRELSKPSSVPTPFILVYQWYFDDCIRAEEAIHAILGEQGFRVSENREFFMVPVYEVIDLIGGWKDVYS